MPILYVTLCIAQAGADPSAYDGIALLHAIQCGWTNTEAELRKFTSHASQEAVARTLAREKTLKERATAPPSFGNLQDKKRREMARVVPVALETLWSSRGGGNNRIRSVTFDPSHTAVAASCADGHVRIYEAATGQ